MKLLKKSVKISNIILIIFTLLFVGACSKKVIVSSITEYKEQVPQDDLLVQAEQAMRAKDYEQAIQLFKSYMTQFPESTLAFVFLKSGDACMAIGLPKQAAYYYAKAYIRSPDPEKEHVFLKLSQAFRFLESDNAESLINDLENSNEKNLIRQLLEKFIYDRYTIGCLLPLSGHYKDFGYSALKGIELALKELNSTGTHPVVKIVIKDTELKPEKAELAVEQLYNEYKIACIIGPIVTAEAAALKAQELNIPIITLTQKDNITEIGDYVFRNFFTPKMHVSALVNYAVNELKADRFGILYPNENYGITFMNLFWDEVINAHGKVVALESYPVDQMDFANHVKKLVGLYYDLPESLKDSTHYLESFNDLTTDYENKDYKNNFSNPDYDSIDKFLNTYGPLSQIFGNKILSFKEKENQNNSDKPNPIVDFEVLFIPDSPKKAGLILPQLAYYDIVTPYIFGTNLWHSNNLINMCYKYVQGAIIPEGFFPQSSSRKVKRFVRYFKNIYGEKPKFIEAIAYDTAMILFNTITKWEVRSREDIKTQLLNLSDFEGITGKTAFNSNGDVEKTAYLLKVDGNRFVEIDK